MRGAQVFSLDILLITDIIQTYTSTQEAPVSLLEGTKTEGFFLFIPLSIKTALHPLGNNGRETTNI